MRPFAVREPLEIAYVREAFLAVEVLDGMTLDRVTQGIEVTAQGIPGKPVLNRSGLFVWKKQAGSQLAGLVIEPRTAPFERVALTAAQMNPKFHSVQLHPLASYPFVPGNTAIRGRLVESDPPATPDTPRVPIPGATMTFEWQRLSDLAWMPWQASRITAAKGDFTAIVRFTRGPTHDDGSPGKPDEPHLEANGNIIVRVTARRPNGAQKQKIDSFPQGRVTDETFAWDAL